MGKQTFKFDKSRFAEQTQFKGVGLTVDFAGVPSRGVYIIRNINNGRMFVGVTDNLQRTIQGAYAALLMGKHEERELQKDFFAGDTFVCGLSSLDSRYRKGDLAAEWYLDRGFDLYNTICGE